MTDRAVIIASQELGVRRYCQRIVAPGISTGSFRPTAQGHVNVGLLVRTVGVNASATRAQATGVACCARDGGLCAL